MIHSTHKNVARYTSRHLEKARGFVSQPSSSLCCRDARLVPPRGLAAILIVIA